MNSITAIRSLYVIPFVFLLMSCQLNLNPANPPRPTIVPVKEVASPAPTAAQLPTATNNPTTAPSETPLPPTSTSPPPTEPPLPSPPAPPALGSLALILSPIATGFTKPLYLTHAGDGSGRLFIIEQPGRILIVQNGATDPTPFLDITAIVGSNANEQGLLSLAFHPNYPANGQFFVYYTNKGGDVVIARYQVSTEPNLADPDSGQVLMTIEEPFSNHNGGNLAFGSDGYLYLSVGDGGAANDPMNNGQNLNILLGKILRIDIDNGEPYGVPENNPFVTNPEARPEIWSYGWRNPWRFSFDRLTGDMYIADVGQNQYEEVHVELAGEPSGQNYGWRLMEGFHCFDPTECDPAQLNVDLPVTEYDHSQGCSVSGGYVYRGQQFPDLTGIYFYGDFCTGRLWGLRHETDGSWSQTEFLQASHNISSFGEDEAGELYLLDHKGSVIQIGN